LSCDECEYREECNIRREYLKAENFYKNGDIEELRKISNLIELDEQYLVEMRRDVNSKLVKLLRDRRKQSK
jgi:hypothetical protein